jgi:hypothetical protein
MNYNCDTPADHYSLLERKQNGAAAEAKGSLVAKQLGSGKFAPLAAVRLQTSDLKTYVGIALVRTPMNKPKQLSMVVRAVLPKQPPQEAKVGDVDLNTQVPFSIVRQGDQAIVTLAAKTMVLPFAFSEEMVVGVSCSTGNFDFLDLEIDGH